MDSCVRNLFSCEKGNFVHIYYMMKYMWFIGLVSLAILGCSYVVSGITDMCAPSTDPVVPVYINDTAIAGTILANSSINVDFGKGGCKRTIYNLTASNELMLIVNASKLCGDPPSCNIDCGGTSKYVRLNVNKTLTYNISFSHSAYNGSVVEMAQYNTSVLLDEALNLSSSSCLVAIDRSAFEIVVDENKIPFLWNAETNNNSLKVAGLIDYEQNTSFTFLMKGELEINKDIPSTATTTIHITVTDIDDNRPSFNISATEHYNLYINENTEFNDAVPTEPPIYAFDQDRGLNKTILYSLVSTDDGPFSIGEQDGKINITQKLDYENKSIYTVIIKAVQEDQPKTRTAVATLLVHVQDLDDNIPMFTKERYNCSVVEHSSENSYICTVTAFDYDTSPENKDFTYFFWEDKDVVTIDNKTGVIKVSNSTALDRDGIIVGNELRIKIGTKIQTDGYGGNTTVVIEVLDINDNNPKFSEEIYHFEITNTTNGTIGIVNATDLDIGMNGEVNYEVLNTPVGSSCSILPTEGVNLFAVNNSSGKISVIKEDIFCYQYQLVVQACDKGINRRCSTATVTIQNSETETPKNLNQTLETYEETVIGTYVGFVKCYSKGRQYEYHGPPVFGIDNTTGTLVTKEVLDRENNDAFDLFVEVLAGEKLLCNVNIRVAVLDVNDNEPKFDLPFYHFTINNTQDNEIFIGSIKATDEDMGENGNISYSLQNSQLVNISMTNGKMFINASNVDRIDVIRVYGVALDKGTPALHANVPVYISGASVTNSVPISTIMTKNAIEESKAKLAGEISEALHMEVLIHSVTSVNNSKYAIRSKVHISPRIGKSSNQEFLSAVVSQYEVIKNIFTQPSAQSANNDDSNNGGLAAPEIGLIAMAGVILIGTIVAVVVIQRQFNSQKRYRQLYETMTKNSSLYESQEIKMDVEDETSSIKGSITEKDLEGTSNPPSPKLVTKAHNPNFQPTDDETHVKLSESTEPKEQTDISNALQELSDSYEKDENDNDELHQDAGANPVVYANVHSALDGTEVVFVTEVEPENVGDSDGEIRRKDSDLIHFDNEEVTDNNTNAEDDAPESSIEDLEEEPNPDYDIKQVRFHTEVLDADENKIEPLKVKTEEIEIKEDNSDEAVVADTDDEAVNNENDADDADMIDGSAVNVSQTSGYSSDNTSSGEHDTEINENEDRLEEEKDFYFETIESTQF
ncbi:long-chain fatty acid transporter fat1 [Mactra antiquata]